MPYPITITPRRMTANEAKRARQLYPQIDTDNVWVIGEATPQYNCLAWTVGIVDSWLWPWPNSSNVSIEQFSVLYDTYGFTPTVGNPSIAGYGHNRLNMTHGSVYLTINMNDIGSTWTSKRGENILITHTRGGLAGPGSFYGDVQQYYKQSLANAPEPPLAEALSRRPRMYALSEQELTVIKEKVDAVDELLKERFDQVYAAWQRTWQDPRIAESSNPADRTHSQQFIDLVALGPDTIPLLMQKLQDPEQFFALQVVERMLLSDIVFRPRMGDIAVLGGEQLRAHETIRRWVSTVA